MSSKRQVGSSIKRVELGSGQIRYRYRLDLEPGADGKRRQRTLTFKTEAEAIADQAKRRVEVGERDYIEPSRRTVDNVLDAWLDEARDDWKASTRYQNESALRAVRAVIGTMPVQRLAREDVSRLRRVLSETGGRGGRGRSARTVTTALKLLGAALDLAVHDGAVRKNVAASVKPPKIVTEEFEFWSAAQLGQFLASVDDDRLVGAWYLSGLGMRRGEVLGARWSDVDWKAGILRVRQARVLVGGEVVAGRPKSVRSSRDVHLDEETLRALRMTRERTLLGGVVPLRQRGGEDGRLIVVDEAGEPFNPHRFSRTFHALVEVAGLPRIRLHDVRHSVATAMLDAGVPVHQVAHHLGHDASVLLKVYSHRTEAAGQVAVGALRRAIGGGL